MPANGQRSRRNRCTPFRRRPPLPRTPHKWPLPVHRCTALCVMLIGRERFIFTSRQCLSAPLSDRPPPPLLLRPLRRTHRAARVCSSLRTAVHPRRSAPTRLAYFVRPGTRLHECTTARAFGERGISDRVLVPVFSIYPVRARRAVAARRCHCRRRLSSRHTRPNSRLPHRRQRVRSTRPRYRRRSGAHAIMRPESFSLLCFDRFSLLYSAAATCPLLPARPPPPVSHSPSFSNKRAPPSCRRTSSRRHSRFRRCCRAVCTSRLIATRPAGRAAPRAAQVRVCADLITDRCFCSSFL